MWPRINRLQIGADGPSPLAPRELLQECEAVARTLRGWQVDTVDVAGLRLDASRRSRLGFADRVRVVVGEPLRLEVTGRAPRWRLERLARDYLDAAGLAAQKRRRGQEAGT